MQKTWRRILLWISGVLLMVSVLNLPVYATEWMEANSEEYNYNNYILNYIYIDCPVIYQYDEQSVAVEIENIQNDKESITDIRLGYSIEGQDYEDTYTGWQDDLIIFEHTVTVIGTYELHYIDIERDTDTVRLDFSDDDIAITDAEYTVIEDYECSDAYVGESETITDESTYSTQGISFDVSQMKPVGANGQVVVVLDPGHDSIHAGASGNGLREEVLTLKIAQYCKAELEKYDNITVYMTRNDGSCLDQSGNGACLKARCNYAASKGANILVSIHIDAGSVTGTGAMVIVAKKGVYRDDLASVTQDIGNSILNELTKLGLASRGLYIRTSDSTGSEYVYANGATADWYAITRNCIKAGIPGIIVEHCYISNPSDASQYLNSDAKLQALGVADATGIANYFGLTKQGSGSLTVGETLITDSTELYESTGENISDFVALLYQRVLGRTPSKAEVSSWVRKVEVEQLTGAALTKRFLNSAEFKLHNYSDAEYIEKLYEVYLGRASDPEGKKHWLSVLQQGATRMQVADRIGNSEEFELVCAKYGIAQGSNKMQYAKLYPDIAEFVTDYYRGLLNREPDAGGLEHWCQFLIQGGTAAELTRRFINSPEFQMRNLNQNDFVEGLYQTYLNRASDESGKEHWMNLLPTMSYDEKLTVIRGFIRSEEYHIHCAKYGIAVGTL